MGATLPLPRKPYYEMCRQWTSVKLSENVMTAHLYRWKCHSWMCAECGREKALKWHKRANLGAVAGHGKFLKFMTLTFDRSRSIDATFALMGPAWNRLLVALKRIDPLLQFLRVVERHKDGYPHMHVLVRSVFLPWKVLQGLAVKAGFGMHVDIRAAKGNGAVAYIIKYLYKAVACPLPKGTQRVVASYGWERGLWQTERRCEPEYGVTWFVLPYNPYYVKIMLEAEGFTVVVHGQAAGRLASDYDAP